MIGIVAILAGAFSFLLILANILTSTHTTTSDQQLTLFNSNQSLYAFLGAAAALFGAFGVAFAAGFSRLVWERSQGVSFAAAFLVATGSLVIAIADNVYVGGLFAISQAPSTPAYALDATYLAAVMDNFTNSLTPLSTLLSGLGMLFFASAIWKRGVLPRWLSYVVLVGGVLGILSSAFRFATSQPEGISMIFIFGFVVLFSIWGIGVGMTLLRGRSPL